MQADTYQLKQIMTPERRFVVPTFQRDYEWTERGQWALLFDDLESTADRLVDARAHAEAAGLPQATADKSVPPHFLGAIVCDQLPSPAGGLDLRAVIDGQQRLTTLQLLVRGVLDLLVEIKSPRIRQVRRLIENPSDVISSPIEKHKLWPRRRDREVWTAVMDDVPPSDTEHLYGKARRYFRDRARIARIGPTGDDRTEALVDALLDLFKLVVIDLEDNDDAQVIFEVLNGRQTPLSAADLVKNLLFLRGELADEHELEKLYEQYWAPFDDAWWKKTVGTGHAARGRRDMLLAAWLTAASGAEANVGQLYADVRKYLRPKDRKTEDVLIELHRYGQEYRRLYQGTDDHRPAVRRAFWRLDVLNNTTAVPVLLWLGTRPPEVLTPADHEVAVLAVESWVVRRMIVGSNTRGYGKAFVDVLSAAKAARGQGSSAIAAAVIDALEVGPNSLAWPDDAELGEACRTKRYYNNYTQQRIRLILSGIETQLRAENPNVESAVIAFDELEIEHIMPQGWKANWPVVAETEGDRVLRTQERDAHVHRLGNLTLVTSAFNKDLTNGSWEEKRAEFKKGESSLLLNARIAAADDWHEASITERADRLGGLAARHWRAPSVMTSQLGIGTAGR